MKTRMEAVAAKITALVLSAGLLVSLAACEGQVPKTASTDAADRTPDLTVAQEKKIRGQILDLIDTANESKSTDGLDARLTGPQLEVRSSELTIAAATGTLEAKATIPRKITQTVIPVNDGWPRTVFTITTTTDDQQSKRLLVMTQDSARQNYKLWGVARLFQGAKLPKFEVPKLGTDMGDPKDSKLVTTPENAVSWYADLLNNGDSSKYKDKFADDLFRSDLQQLDATVQQGMEANKSMRSTDGGDLVVARIDSTWTRQAGEGRESLPASDQEKALFGDGKATSTMKVTYVNVIAMYIPPAGSAGDAAKIVAVGAERQPVKVEAL